VSHITHLLVNRIATQLDSDLRVAVSDKYIKAKVVKPYRFQASPIENNIYLYVTSGDPDDPSLMDGRVTVDETDNLKMSFPAGEIGGGHYWWRRGTIYIGAYYVTDNLDQDVAANYAQTVRGRAEYYAERVNVANLVDEFGERAYYLMVISGLLTEGGGPENQYLWRGKLIWQALTHRPY
jgi:hypothetical protein